MHGRDVTAERVGGTLGLCPGVPAIGGGQRHLDRITSAHSSNLFQICPNPSLVALGFVSLPCTPPGVWGLRAGGAANPPLSASLQPLKSPQSSIQTFGWGGVGCVYIFFPLLLFPPLRISYELSSV